MGFPQQTNSARLTEKAGDRIRTGDIQLGKSGAVVSKGRNGRELWRGRIRPAQALAHGNGDGGGDAGYIAAAVPSTRSAVVRQRCTHGGDVGHTSRPAARGEPVGEDPAVGTRGDVAATRSLHPAVYTSPSFRSVLIEM